MALEQRLHSIDFEKNIESVEAFLFPELADEDLPKAVLSLDYIDKLLNATTDIHAHEKLQKTLSNLSKWFLKNNETVYTSWEKRLVLSSKQRASVKESLQKASRLLSVVWQICKDLQHIQNEIEWIKVSIPTTSLNEAECKEVDILPEAFTKALLWNLESCIKTHTENIESMQGKIEEYMDLTKEFLELEENTAPKPGLTDRVSFILTTLPSLLGGAITAIAYVFGATAILTLIPLSVGIVTSCISAALYVLNVSKFIPAEKIRQVTEERKELVESVFPPVLDLLRKANKMNSVGSGGSTNGSLPATSAIVYAFNKPIKEDTAAILDELKVIKANQQRQEEHQRKLAQDVAPLLRSRTTSINSLNSNSSSSSEPLIIGRPDSRSNSPEIAELRKANAELQQEVTELKTALTDVKQEMTAGQEAISRQLAAQNALFERFLAANQKN